MVEVGSTISKTNFLANIRTVADIMREAPKVRSCLTNVGSGSDASRCVLSILSTCLNFCIGEL